LVPRSASYSTMIPSFGPAPPAFPCRAIDHRQAAVLAHGGRVDPAGITGTYAALDPEGRVVALLAERDGRAAPVVVLRPAG